MRTLSLVVALALSASPAYADDSATTSRGFLSGLGLGLLVGGFTGVGLGLSGTVSANDAAARRAAYGPAVVAEDAPTVSALQDRVSLNTTLAVVGFTVGGLALAGGVACLVLDTPVAKVAFVPSAQGGVLVFSGRF